MELHGNPLSGVDYSFKTYLDRRKDENARHMDGNAIPDYAFGMDYTLRRRLDSIPGLFWLARKLSGTAASTKKAELNMSAVCATPTTFPDLYEVGCECARRLGTAIPSIYLVNSPQLNAYTVATDDTEPMVVIYSALYERLTRGELKAVIGHECGHFQNYHSTYNILAQLLLEEGLAGVGRLAGRGPYRMMTAGAGLMLQAWSRAAEVTADRASMICADSLEDFLSLHAKFMYGGAFGEHQVDYESLKEQLRQQMNNPTKYAELLLTHPAGVRRIMAAEEFARCEVYFDWRPDMKKPDSIRRSRKECDERCRRFIALNEKAKGQGR